MYLEQLEKAIKYAQENESFNALNLIKNADNVCVFGLGTYFREAFVSQRTQEMYNVNLLCDNDAQKWGKDFEGIKCISPEELKNYKNLIVIIMLGNPMPVERQLSSMGIPYINHIKLSIDRIMKLPTDKAWFINEEKNILKVLSLFDDDESKRIYVNALCNRIAPTLSNYFWDELYTEEEQYFNQNYIKFDNNEVFVDCGGYTGDSVIGFCNAVKDYNKIFSFEQN